MPIPLAVPIALGGAKLLGDIFGGKSHEQELRDRIRRAREQNAARRQQETRDAYGNISREAGDLISSSRSAATERAIAMGRPQDANSFILPAEAKIGEYASNAQHDALQNIGQRYNQNEYNIDNQELNSDYGSNAGDYVGQITGAGLNYVVGSDMLEGMDYTPSLDTPPISPLPQNPIGSPSINGAVGGVNNNFADPTINSNNLFADPTNNIFSSGYQYPRLRLMRRRN